MGGVEIEKTIDFISRSEGDFTEPYVRKLNELYANRMPFTLLAINSIREKAAAEGKYPIPVGTTTVNPRAQEMVEALVTDHDLPLGVIASFRPDHPLLRKLDEDAIRASTAVGTIGMLLNAGPFHKELTRLSREEVVPLFGSSANLSGTGTRFSVEEIPDGLKQIADITIEYGLRRYHTYRRAGTLINFDTLQVVRIGACYELIAGVLKRWFDVELPADPGLEALPSGHLAEFALKNVQ